MLAHADILFLHWPKVRDGTRTRRWFARAQAGWLRVEVRALLERGRACPCPKTAGVCRELLAVEASLWTFARVDGVEPTNNHMERLVRLAVLWRRRSFGCNSEMVMQYAQKHARITRKETAELCQLSLDQASRLLRRLVKQGRLVSQKEGRGAYYTLK